MGLALTAALALGTMTACQPEAQGLSTEDQDALVFMYEEEKLARDVYITLGDLWGANQHMMIQDSEQKHMDAIGVLLTDYEIAYTTLAVGEYNNPDLKTLYDDLVAQGAVSKLEAFKVGALVEDLDIVDLQEYMDATEEAAILGVYESLQCGSRNHLRAFMMGVTNEGGTYTPQFLTQEEFDAILAGEHESCD